MRVRLVLGAVALLLIDREVAADAAPRPSDPRSRLRAAVNADVLELAGVCERVGDDAVLALLASGPDLVAQLAAVRATPYLRNPELALSSLTTLASGRDPDLAPAAARRILQIAQALALEGLTQRELSAAELQPLEPALSALAQAATAQPDLRLYAGQAAHLLGQLHAQQQPSQSASQ